MTFVTSKILASLVRPAGWFAIALAVAVPATVAAQPVSFVEGTHYEELRNTETIDGNVRVAEIFWYGCPHCYNLEPVITRWKAELADDVDFERLPTAFGRASGLPLLRAYYAAKELNVENEVHNALFKALHEENRFPLAEDDIAGMFVAAGVADADFRKTFKGFSVDNQVRRAEARVRHFGVTGVPTLIVDGRWRVNNNAVDNFEELLKVVDFLVAKARGNR